MTYEEAVRAEVEEHVAKWGMASLWATPGVWEAVAECPEWTNSAHARMDASSRESDTEEALTRR